MRIGIYCRVSSYSQKSEGYSIDNQRVRGIEYCDKMGYDYEIFEDVISGSIVNRKGLINWINDYERFCSAFDNYEQLKERCLKETNNER